MHDIIKYISCTSLYSCICKSHFILHFVFPVLLTPFIFLTTASTTLLEKNDYQIGIHGDVVLI